MTKTLFRGGSQNPRRGQNPAEFRGQVGAAAAAPIHTLELSALKSWAISSHWGRAGYQAYDYDAHPSLCTTVAYADALCILDRRSRLRKGATYALYVLRTLQLVPEEAALPLRRSAHTASGIRFRA